MICTCAEPVFVLDVPWKLNGVLWEFKRNTSARCEQCGFFVKLCVECGQVMTLSTGYAETLVGYPRGACGEIHDDNCMTRWWSCKNEHFEKVQLRRRCTKCDWVGKESCGTCGGTKKVDKWPDE